MTRLNGAMTRETLISIWDLDGTLADTTKRLPLILVAPPQKPDWEQFNKLANTDKLILPAAVLYKALLHAGIFPVICTSRFISNLAITTEWLKTYQLPYRALLMRPDNDTRPSATLKRDMLREVRLRYGRVAMAFEDQPESVAMYRENGVYCWAADDKDWKLPFAGEQNTLSAFNAGA